MASAEIELNNNSFNGGGTAAVSASTAQPKDDLSYDAVFPSLPSSGLDGIANTWSMDTSKLAVKRQTVTQVFHVPVEERRYRDVQAFGNETNQRCEQIAQRYGVKVEICCSKDQSLHIVITGAEEKVLEAKRTIVSELQTENKVQFKVPKELHKFIIGRSGNILKDLQEKTCTTINVPKSDANLDYVTINGPKDGIERAMHEIQLICDEQSKSGLERLKIPKMYHAWIRGPYNETANGIMSQTGAKINIPPADLEKDEITVTGDKEKVDVAAAEILKIYNLKKKVAIKKLEIQITKSQHKLLIGKNGQTVQDVFRDYDVYVQVPRADSQSETITLYGEDSKLGSALTQVYSKANSVISTQITVPSWLHRYIIGEKGANISKITADYPGAHVKFEADNKILLDGPPDEVEKLQKCLQNIASELQQVMSYDELNVDTKFCGHICGKSYENIARLRQEYGVSIRVPQETSPLSTQTTIRIEGTKDMIFKAKAEIVELLKTVENKKSKDIIIEQKFHSNLIGQGGKNINEIRQKFNDIQISIPNADDKSDVVTVRGDKGDVDKCVKYLQTLVKDMELSNFKEEVHISKKFHRMIIGKQGAFIRKVRDETSTRIDVPADNADSDVIVITGKRENVLRAQKLINDKVSEIVKLEEDHVSIAHSLHTALIGRRGAIIKQIRAECGGVIINFPPENGTPSDVITLKGVREDIDKAKEELLKLAKHKNELSFTDEINCKPEYHRYLIGPKGATINQLREKHNVRVIFPSADATGETAGLITIVGREESVKQVRTELEATIKSLDEQVQDEVQVDAKWHKNFTAKRGKIVNKISEENCNVRISFPRAPDTNTVTIKGPKEAVAAAKKRLLEVVYELENQVQLEVVIPQKYHASVIGKRGQAVQQMSEDYHVEVQFPARAQANENDENGSPAADTTEQPSTFETTAVDGQASPSKLDVVIVVGLKEDCERARDALLALVPVHEEVDFPSEFHVNLLANKAELLKKFYDDHGVQVFVPKRGDETNHVKLIGVRDANAAVKEILNEKLKEFEGDRADREARNFKLELDIKPEYIQLLRGKNGADVVTLNETYDVKINFSRKGEPDRVIIRGYEKNANEAKAEIEARIKAYDSKVTQEIQVDTRIHSRIIGAQGKNLKKITEKYNVDIRFPVRGSQTPDLIVVQGDTEDAVDDACDYLKNLEEEYLQDISDRDAYRHPSRVEENNNRPMGNPNGFVVKGAPWEQQGNGVPDTLNMEDFPSIATVDTASSAGGSRATWGPRK